MSLSASMWTGVSGLLAHSEKMGVVGNNIANVNTIGFKSQRMDFADLMYLDKYTNGGLNQKGLGTIDQTIITSFSQGPYESTTNPTDLAINGAGFFQVRSTVGDQMYYTRAGNFTFDKYGNLTDPNNYILQGWKIDNQGGITRASGGLTANEDEAPSAILGTGSPQDVKLDAWTIQPFATTKMSFIVNLSSDKGADNSINTANPFAALMNRWDGTQPPTSPSTPPIPQEGYSYQTTMEVYDEAGVKHNVTVYYDKIDSNDYEGGENGGSMWEYMVTMDPAEDKRQFWEVDPRHPDGGTLRDMSETKMAGVLASGTLSFNSSGQAVNQSTYSFLGGTTPEAYPDFYTQVLDQGTGEMKWVPKMNTGYEPDPALVAGGTFDPDNPEHYVLDKNDARTPESLEMWRTAEVSASGYPVVVPNFTGILDAQTTGSPNGDDRGIELTFGMKASNLDAPWTRVDASLADLSVDPYTYNPSYNPIDPTKGPEYLLNNLLYDPSALGEITLILNDIENAWKDAEFQDGAGNEVTFDQAFWNAGDDNIINQVVGSIASSKITRAGGGTTAVAEAKALIDKLAGLLSTPLDAIEEGFNNADFEDTAGNPIAFADIFPVPGQPDPTKTIADIAGSAAYPYVAPNANKDALKQAQVFLDQASAPNVTVSLIDKSMRHQFKDTTDGSAPILIGVAGTAGNIKTVDPQSDIMKYLKAVRDSGTTAGVDMSDFSAATPANANGLGVFAKPVVLEDNAVKSLAGSSATYSQSQNGYGFGDLTSYHVTNGGVLNGVYSNGITMPLYQIVMYDFTSPQNLRREGGNVFSQTLDSGDPKSGPPGVAGLGTITSNTIEQSNVDMAREFVLMITTQRGYQGNSKTITTVDTMLETVINLKR